MRKTNGLIRNANKSKSNFDEGISALVGEHKTTPVPNARGVVGQASHFPGFHPEPNWKEYFE